MSFSIGNLISGAVSGLGSLATTALHDLAPAASQEATKIFNGVVGDAFTGVNSLAQGLVSSLPSPFQSLAGKLLGEGSAALQSMATNAGDKAIANLFGQGSTVNGVNVPSVIGTPSRNASTTTAAISTVAQSLLSPAAAAAPAAASTGSSSAAATADTGLTGTTSDMSSMLNTGNTATENQMLGSITDPTMKAQMQYQLQLQHQQEVTEFVSNVMKMLHDMRKGIIDNFRA